MQTNFWCFGGINDIHSAENIERIKQNTSRDLRIMRFSQKGFANMQRRGSTQYKNEKEISYSCKKCYVVIVKQIPVLELTWIAHSPE